LVLERNKNNGLSVVLNQDDAESLGFVRTLLFTGTILRPLLKMDVYIVAVLIVQGDRACSRA
jgi:hypothetical protein